MHVAVDSENNIYELSSLEINHSNNEIIKHGIDILSEKEKMMKAKSLILVHKKSNRIIFELNMIQNQHYYPLIVLHLHLKPPAFYDNVLTRNIPPYYLLTLSPIDFSKSKKIKLRISVTT